MNMQQVSIGKQSNVRFLLVTANTGTVFEKTELLTPWVNEFARLINLHPADFVALHCQEVGGKDYERFMHILDPFIKGLLEIPEIATNYTHYRLYLDSDYTSQETFTALGSLYFFRNDLPIHQWNFHTSSFKPVSDRQIFTGNLSNIQTIRKEKFPPHFYPETKWFRKGFMQTRWSINDFQFDMVNVHLFHDASNILAADKSPSVYSQYRKNALQYTLNRLTSTPVDQLVPFAIFGDFNFRLDASSLLQHIAAKRSCSINKVRSSTTDEVTKIMMKNTETNTRLTVEKKEFNFYDDHDPFFITEANEIRKFDSEFLPFTDDLFEYPKEFPPSYPYSEEHNEPRSYLRARCPAWCDRILLSHSFNKHANNIKIPVIYNLIGNDVCMGDHKPVFLTLTIDVGEGRLLHPSSIDSLPPASSLFSDCENRVATTNCDPCIISILPNNENYAKNNLSKSPVTVVRNQASNTSTDIILNDFTLQSNNQKNFNIHDYAIFTQPGVLPLWWLNELRQRPNRPLSNSNNSSSALWAKVRAVTYMTTLAHRTGSWYSDDQTGIGSDDENDASLICEADENCIISNTMADPVDISNEVDLSIPIRRSFSSINCTQPDHEEQISTTTNRRHSTTEVESPNIMYETKTFEVTTPHIYVPVKPPQPATSSRVYRFLHCIIL